MITSVYSASDSISTKPRSSANRIASAAPGLRAMPSAAEATALACARPQRPLAMAIPKPALMGTHWPLAVGLPGVPAVCANAMVAARSIRATPKHIFFDILVLLRNRPQEVVPVILVQPGSH